MLLHCVNNKKKLINICIANDGKHIADVIRIKLDKKKVFYVFIYFYQCVHTLWSPSCV